MKRGFTLIEIMVTLAVLTIITVVAGVNLTGARRKADLTNATTDIGSLLREAQGDSTDQSQNALWGVHFDNTNSVAPFYELFYVSSSNPTFGSSTNAGRYMLPSDLCYATSSVAVGTSTNIIFNGISGAPTGAVTIILQLMNSGGCSTATSSGVTGGVSRSASGLIFFDNFNRSNL